MKGIIQVLVDANESGSSFFLGMETLSVKLNVNTYTPIFIFDILTCLKAYYNLEFNFKLARLDTINAGVEFNRIW